MLEIQKVTDPTKIVTDELVLKQMVEQDIDDVALLRGRGNSVLLSIRSKYA